jgi:hypothetical protein
MRLPFPFSGYPLPAKAFYLEADGPGTSCYFQHIGREAFNSIWSAVQDLAAENDHKGLCIDGTFGSGKSFILAALACLLLRKGCRVVYFPDCQAFLEAPVFYALHSLLQAFAGDETSPQWYALAQCRTWEDIRAFIRDINLTQPLYFVLDRFSAFEPKHNQMDRVFATQKMYSDINEMMKPHIRITSSAPYGSRDSLAQQNQIFLNGGMSAVSKFAKRLFPHKFLSLIRV